MIIKRTYLYENVQGVYFDAYICDKRTPENGRPAMIIIPGGAYNHCSEREAEPVAKKFIAEGYNAFVLYYSLAPDIIGKNGEFLPLVEAAKTVAAVRRRSSEFGVDPERIGIIGFSAGGHIAGMLETKWHTPELCALAGASSAEIKPNAAILCYAPTVSSFYTDWFSELAGNRLTPNESLIEYFSVEKGISENTPPTFLWHTADDKIVPVECSLLTAAALKKAEVPFELHIYPHGGHGLSVCNDEVGTPDGYVSAWISCAMKWLKATM